MLHDVCFKTIASSEFQGIIVYLQNLFISTAHLFPLEIKLFEGGRKS